MFLSQDTLPEILDFLSKNNFPQIKVNLLIKIYIWVVKEFWMKKGILIAASIFTVIIIFSGVFSAGLIVGNILNNNRTPIPNSFAELPVINQTENQASGVNAN